jgi:16S rRNA (guanine(966)-N(2))-methyltransferase RsmD
MRVIAGEFRGRVLVSPPGLETRPTPDRLRESLFNILAPRIEGTVFVDAYAGCGAVGIEALSRGAARAVFVERSRQCIRVIQGNLGTLGILDRARVIHGNVSTYIASLEADLFFLDPPYDAVDEYTRTLTKLGVHGPAIVIAQHATRVGLAETFPRLRRYRQVKQGNNSLSFYETMD